jgi:hypothetical protein
MHAIAARPPSGLLKRVAISVATAAALLLLGYIAVLWMTCGDILRAYPSPETHDHVHEIALSDAQVALDPESESGRTDFDGDGTPDELDVEYFHMEPLFSRTTSGMVYVRSGRTNELLLAHAVDTPLCRAHWCGDLDGNGTDDLRIRDDGRCFALGYQRKR